MVRKYEVYYKDDLIGILEVELETRKHKFIPNAQGVEKTKEKACHIVEILNGTEGFVNPIPFFENRLINGERLGLTVINYQTDNYVIKRVSEE